MTQIKLQSRPIEMRIFHRNESCSKACSAHFATAATLLSCHSCFSLLLKEQNGGVKKVLKSLS